jgi:hypothetical protein
LALLAELIDYAGLFPPAALGLEEAVDVYARHRLSPDAWMVGRFVVPCTRLGEFEQAVGALSPEQRGAQAWRLAVLAATPLTGEVAAVTAFNQRHAGGAAYAAHIDALEVKPSSSADTRRVAAMVPDYIELFFECTLDDSLDESLVAIRNVGRAAKIRTGGVTPEAIPDSGAVARFISRCAVLGVPFKATAGLHHAVRSRHPLTYGPAAPVEVMHGFLNVFMASVLAYDGRHDIRDLSAVLEEMRPDAFGFSNAGITWRDQAASVTQVERARHFARRFGSCSIREPLADLEAVGWLGPHSTRE